MYIKQLLSFSGIVSLKAIKNVGAKSKGRFGR